MWTAGQAEATHPKWAGQVYSLIKSSEAWSGVGGIAKLRERAGARLDALSGKGWSGEHWEVMGSRLSRELTDPIPLMAFAAGSLAFRSARWWAGSRLAAAKTATLFSQGRGLNWSANAAGLFAESAAFPLALHLGDRLRSHPTLGDKPWHSTWAQSALFLGSLRLGGGLANAARQSWLPWVAPASRMAGPLLDNAGLYSGILLGHRLGELAAGQNPSGHEGVWILGLAELLQIRIASRLGSGLIDNVPRPFSARQRSSREFFPDGLRVMAGASTLIPFQTARQNPLFPNVLQMASLPPITCAYPTSGFSSVKTIRSPIGKGQSFLDIGTRNSLPKAEHARLLLDFEDGFSSLLNGFHTREANLFRGPISALFQSKPKLRRAFLDHLDQKTHRLWGLIDADTGFIQRLVALDSNSRPKMVLALEVIPGEMPRSSGYRVIQLRLEHEEAGWPEVEAKKYEFAGNKFEKFEPEAADEPFYNGIPRRSLDQPELGKQIISAPELSLSLFPNLSQTYLLRMARGPSPRWELKNPAGLVLFQVRPSGREGMHIFQWSAGEHIDLSHEQAAFEVHREKVLSETPIPSPKPKSPPKEPGPSQLPKIKSRPVSKAVPKETTAEKDSSPNALPPPKPRRSKAPNIPKPPRLPQGLMPRPSAELLGLDRVRELVQDVDLGLNEDSPQIDGRIHRLQEGIMKLSDTDFEKISAEIDGLLPTWLPLTYMSPNLVPLLLTRSNAGERLRRAFNVAPLLVSEFPQRRSGAFEFFRGVVPKLPRHAMVALQAHLLEKYPLKGLAPDVQLMVQQVHILLRDWLADS